MNIGVTEISPRAVQRAAEKNFKSGYYCCEALMCTIRDEFKLDVPKEVIAMSSGMAVGAGKSGCVCGAFNGGLLMVLFPGQWHTYYPLRQTGWTEYYIGFEGPAIDTIVGDAFLSQERQILEVGINEELVSLFSRALEVAEADKISAQQYLSGIVLHMIGMILSISKNKVFEMIDVDQKIEQAKILMNENVSGNIDPEELAMRLNISYSWFRRVFKEYTGYAPAKYFQELKLRKAKQMLVGTSQSVKEISFFLGFQSTEYFFSFFKKRTGLTPLEYRSFGREE